MEALIDLAARSPVDSSNGSSKRRASSASREPSALGRLCSAVAAAFAEETTVVNVHSDSPLAVTGDVAHTHIEFDAATKLAQALATQEALNKLVCFALDRRWSSVERSAIDAGLPSATRNMSGQLDDESSPMSLLEGLLEHLRSLPVSTAMVQALHTCAATTTKPVVRQQTFTYFFDWVKQQLHPVASDNGRCFALAATAVATDTSSNTSNSGVTGTVSGAPDRRLQPLDTSGLQLAGPADFDAFKTFILAGLGDVWSAIRKSCASRLFAVIDRVPLPLVAEVYTDLVALCTSAKRGAWRQTEGALLGMAMITKRFRRGAAVADPAHLPAHGHRAGHTGPPVRTASMHQKHRHRHHHHHHHRSHHHHSHHHHHHRSHHHNSHASHNTKGAHHHHSNAPRHSSPLHHGVARADSGGGDTSDSSSAARATTTASASAVTTPTHSDGSATSPAVASRGERVTAEAATGASGGGGDSGTPSSRSKRAYLPTIPDDAAPAGDANSGAATASGARSGGGGGGAGEGAGAGGGRSSGAWSWGQQQQQQRRVHRTQSDTSHNMSSNFRHRPPELQLAAPSEPSGSGDALRSRSAQRVIIVHGTETLVGPTLWFGAVYHTTLPAFIVDTMRAVVYPSLAHPQLSVRENAIRLFAAYLVRCDLYQTVVSLKEVLNMLRGEGVRVWRRRGSNSDSATPEPSGASASASAGVGAGGGAGASAAESGSGNTASDGTSVSPRQPKRKRRLSGVSTGGSGQESTTIQDPYTAEGVLGLAVIIVRLSPTSIFLRSWDAVFQSLIAYLSHPASTVRQMTSKVLLQLSAKGREHGVVPLLPWVLKGVVATWDAAAAPSPRPSSATSTASTSPRAANSSSSSSMSWEGKEGCLLTYELLLNFLLASHRKRLHPFASLTDIKPTSSGSAQNMAGGATAAAAPGSQVAKQRRQSHSSLVSAPSHISLSVHVSGAPSSLPSGTPMDHEAALRSHSPAGPAARTAQATPAAPTVDTSARSDRRGSASSTGSAGPGHPTPVSVNVNVPVVASPKPSPWISPSKLGSLVSDSESGAGGGITPSATAAALARANQRSRLESDSDTGVISATALGAAVVVTPSSAAAASEEGRSPHGAHTNSHGQPHHSSHHSSHHRSHHGHHGHHGHHMLPLSLLESVRAEDAHSRAAAAVPAPIAEVAEGFHDGNADAGGDGAAAAERGDSSSIDVSQGIKEGDVRGTPSEDNGTPQTAPAAAAAAAAATPSAAPSGSGAKLSQCGRDMSMTHALRRLLSQTKACILEPQFELRRMGDQVLPLLTEFCMWYDLGLLHDLWAALPMAIASRDARRCLLAARTLSWTLRRVRQLELNTRAGQQLPGGSNNGAPPALIPIGGGGGASHDEDSRGAPTVSPSKEFGDGGAGARASTSAGGAAAIAATTTPTAAHPTVDVRSDEGVAPSPLRGRKLFVDAPPPAAASRSRHEAPPSAHTTPSPGHLASLEALTGGSSGHAGRGPGSGSGSDEHGGFVPDVAPGSSGRHRLHHHSNSRRHNRHGKHLLVASADPKAYVAAVVGRVERMLPSLFSTLQSLAALAPSDSVLVLALEVLLILQAYYGLAGAADTQTVLEEPPAGDEDDEHSLVVFNAVWKQHRHVRVVSNRIGRVLALAMPTDALMCQPPPAPSFLVSMQTMLRRASASPMGVDSPYSRSSAGSPPLRSPLLGNEAHGSSGLGSGTPPAFAKTAAPVAMQPPAPPTAGSGGEKQGQDAAGVDAANDEDGAGVKPPRVPTTPPPRGSSGSSSPAADGGAASVHAAATSSSAFATPQLRLALPRLSGSSSIIDSPLNGSSTPVTPATLGSAFSMRPASSRLNPTRRRRAVLLDKNIASALGPLMPDLMTLVTVGEGTSLLSPILQWLLLFDEEQLQLTLLDAVNKFADLALAATLWPVGVIVQRVSPLALVQADSPAPMLAPVPRPAPGTVSGAARLSRDTTSSPPRPPTPPRGGGDGGPEGGAGSNERRASALPRHLRMGEPGVGRPRSASTGSPAPSLSPRDTLDITRLLDADAAYWSPQSAPFGYAPETAAFAAATLNRAHAAHGGGGGDGGARGSLEAGVAGSGPAPGAGAGVGAGAGSSHSHHNSNNTSTGSGVATSAAAMVPVEALCDVRSLPAHIEVPTLTVMSAESTLVVRTHGRILSACALITVQLARLLTRQGLRNSVMRALLDTIRRMVTSTLSPALLRVVLVAVARACVGSCPAAVVRGESTSSIRAVRSARAVRISNKGSATSVFSGKDGSTPKRNGGSSSGGGGKSTSSNGKRSKGDAAAQGGSTSSSAAALSSAVASAAAAVIVGTPPGRGSGAGSGGGGGTAATGDAGAADGSGAGGDGGGGAAAAGEGGAFAVPPASAQVEVDPVRNHHIPSPITMSGVVPRSPGATTVVWRGPPPPTSTLRLAKSATRAPSLSLEEDVMVVGVDAAHAAAITRRHTMNMSPMSGEPSQVGSPASSKSSVSASASKAFAASSQSSSSEEEEDDGGSEWDDWDDWDEDSEDSSSAPSGVGQLADFVNRLQSAVDERWHDIVSAVQGDGARVPPSQRHVARARAGSLQPSSSSSSSSSSGSNGLLKGNYSYFRAVMDLLSPEDGRVLAWVMNQAEGVNPFESVFRPTTALSLAAAGSLPGAGSSSSSSHRMSGLPPTPTPKSKPQAANFAAAGAGAGAGRGGGGDRGGSSVGMASDLLRA